jgi:hypothetical protein
MKLGPQNAGDARGIRPLERPPTRALLWTRWGPRPLAYLTTRNSKAGSTPGFNTGARSHPQHDAIPLCVVRCD